MPEKAKVRTRAMAAAERSAVTDCRPGRLRATLRLSKDDEGKGNAAPRRIAGRPHVTHMRRMLTLALLLVVGLAGTSRAAPRRVQFGPPASEVAFRYGDTIVRSTLSPVQESELLRVPPRLPTGGPPQGEPMGRRVKDEGESECRPVTGRIGVETSPCAKAS